MSKIPSVDSMNAVVARITGVSQRVLPRTGSLTEKKELAARGDNAAYGSMPGKHEMPPKEPEEKIKGADDQDDDDMQDLEGKKKAESKTLVGGISMTEFRMLAGLTPMYETSVSEPPVTAGTSRPGKTGDVWTGGVDKQNKMAGGLPGLEGDAVQDIDPKEGPEGEDHVGDAKEVTFDDAVAMLKKEGISMDDVWKDFLENRGLTVDVFLQLVDEANDSEDQAEVDALLAVEDIFRRWVVEEVLKSLGRPVPVAEGKGFGKGFGKLKGKMAKPFAPKQKLAKKNPFFAAKDAKGKDKGKDKDKKKAKDAKADKFAMFAKKGKKSLRRK